MAETTLSSAVRDFLVRSVVPGVLATIGRSGGPVTSAVWFGIDGDDILVSTPSEGTKAQNVRRDARVSFIVDSKERPYAGVAIEGSGVVLDDPDLLQWRKVAARYVGDDISPEMKARLESRPRAIVRIVPRRVRTWNLAES